MRINTNLNAMTALNSSTKTTALAGNSMEKLSSGLRINKAGDDAAGLAISEKMRAQIRGMEQADRNTQDGISMVQTAEGAMEEVGNIAQRMRELSVQSANETNTSEDRAKISEELSQLHDEINRIADSTEFNGKSLLNGTKKVDTKIEVKLTETKSEFEINESDLQKLGLKGGQTISIAASAGTDTGNNTTKLTLTVSGGEVFELDNIESNGTAGQLKSDGKLVLKSTTSGNTIEIDVKSAAIGKAVTGGDIVTAENLNKDVYGTNVSLQVGANTNSAQELNVNIQNLSTDSLGLGEDKSAINAMSEAGTSGTNAAKRMITSLDKALESINTGRANLGAMQNRLETTSSNLTTSTENLTAAESRIRDVDVAKEMVKLSKLNILTQASQAMVAQAKQQPESVTQLLR